MEPLERHARLKEIFLKALDVPLRELPAFLDEACGDDDELRRDVESLIRYHLPKEPSEESENGPDGEIGAAR